MGRRGPSPIHPIPPLFHIQSGPRPALRGRHPGGARDVHKQAVLVRQKGSQEAAQSVIKTTGSHAQRSESPARRCCWVPWLPIKSPPHGRAIRGEEKEGNQIRGGNAQRSGSSFKSRDNPEVAETIQQIPRLSKRKRGSGIRGSCHQAAAS